VTPGARLQAAIDILDALDEDARPADRFMRAWFASRRFMGAKDRRTVMRRAYTILRSRARLDWWCRRHGVEPPIANRLRVIASLVLTDGIAEAAIAQLFDGGPYRPNALDDRERTLIAALDGHMLDSAEQPESVRGEYPGWLDNALHAAFDGAVVHELQALNRTAPLDLRVNTMKVDRATAIDRLGAEGVAAEIAPLSPVGLRVADHPRLDGTSALRQGIVEIQDEGSQIVALLGDPQPGATIVDYCAGAGGKTLALAAAMRGDGRLVACDVDPKRLHNMTPRLARAGIAEFVEVRAIAEDDPIADLDGAADLVLADVPCSTSGAWRRDPAAKWRLTTEAIDRYCGVQAQILERAAALVRPGGRLVYATCSILPAENERQVDRFAAAREDFSIEPAGPAFDRLVGRDGDTAEPFLRLTPARSNTDGYFVAILRRAP